ncbi:MAG: hypothetical protein HC836_34490 [Richelia sp. RM2_1_2]|nr:hypothetical protein [Richelia sp. RM2_1_2]
MIRLPNELRQECITIFLKCELFDTVDNLISFCKPIHIIGDLIPQKLKTASNKKLFINLNLPILLETKHTEEGYIFPLFLSNLRDYYDEEDNDWRIVNDLYTRVEQELDNSHQRYQTSSPMFGHQLFESLIAIDFKDQEKYVTKAIESQRMRRRTVAFLVNGYDYRYGQAIFLERLFRKVPEFKNLRKIQIKLDNITEISDFWKQITPEFISLSVSNSMSPKEIQQQIIEKISICLQSQNIIFIFHVYDRCFPEILTDLILEFWQPIHGINDSDNYLGMFLIDYQGKCANSLGVYLASHFEDKQKYPKYPLFLNKINDFTSEHLEEWLENDEKVSQKLLNGTSQRNFVDQLLKESQWGIPELVYRNICSYFDVSWEEIDQCQIR